MDIKEMAKRMFHAFFIIFTGSILAMCASTALFFWIQWDSSDSHL